VNFGSAMSVGCSVSVITLGSAAGVHRAEPSPTVARGAKSQPPAPGECVHLGLIQHAAPIGAFQSPPVLRKVRIAVEILPGEARGIQRSKFLIRSRRGPIPASHGRLSIRLFADVAGGINGRVGGLPTGATGNACCGFRKEPG
jgi:hypothetical protein